MSVEIEKAADFASRLPYAGGEHQTPRNPACGEPEEADADAAATLIDARAPVAIGGGVYLDVGAGQLVAVAHQPIDGRGRHGAPGIAGRRARQELERSDRVRVREREAQAVDGKESAEVEVPDAGPVLSRGATDLLPLARRGDSGVARLDREAGQLEWLGAPGPRHAEEFRLPGRHVDPELLEARAAGGESHDRRAARQRCPLTQVVAGLDHHTREDLRGASGQLERDGPDRLLERPRVGQISNEPRVARGPALARAYVDDCAVAALLDAQLDGLHSGRRIGADRKQ